MSGVKIVLGLLKEIVFEDVDIFDGAALILGPFEAEGDHVDLVDVPILAGVGVDDCPEID
jgi:hypothetical protein